MFYGNKVFKHDNHNHFQRHHQDKVADEVVVGLITENEEAYPEKVENLTCWSRQQLLLNVSKTKEMIIEVQHPLNINSFNNLGVHIIEGLTWTQLTDSRQ